jgi:hypothetical protein
MESFTLVLVHGMIQSSDHNISADVLDTAYAFTDLIGERPESGYVFTDVFEERPKSLPAQHLHF